MELKQFTDLKKTIANSIEKALTEQGKANILIAGKTGVGKSSLINAIFQGNMAKTGQGMPVTSEIREIRKDDIPVTLIDTKGLELEQYAPILDELETYVKEKGDKTDPVNHIHLAWLCIQEESRRVEGSERKLVQMLHRNKIPVVVVITKARADKGFDGKSFKAEVEKLIPEAGNVIRVRALKQVDDDGHETKTMGLKELAELSMGIVPEGQKNAFAAAQKVSMKKKVERADIIVASSATAAAAAAVANPTPGTDAFFIVPIQIGMLAGVSAVFGLPMNKAFLGTLISGSFMTVLAPEAGRALFYSIVKVIPGLNIGAQILQGATATLITTVLGKAYVSTLALLSEKYPDKPLTAEQIAEVFKEELKKREN